VPQPKVAVWYSASAATSSSDRSSTIVPAIWCPGLQHGFQPRHLARQLDVRAISMVGGRSSCCGRRLPAGQTEAVAFNGADQGSARGAPRSRFAPFQTIMPPDTHNSPGGFWVIPNLPGR
jgi:hypothetical protein